MATVSATYEEGTATVAVANPTQIVVVHDGQRGRTGLQGEVGPEGPQGDGITILGQWATGQTYAAGEAVTWRSSAVNGVQSLYIQRTGWPTEISTIPPNEDVARWSEIGATDLSNITGAIWSVYQVAHGFEYVGTPAAFSFDALRYVKADNVFADSVAISAVREVIDENRFVLQSSGQMLGLDSKIITPAGSTWEQGRLYYVSGTRGLVQKEIPDQDTNGTIHPILMPTTASSSGGTTVQDGVVLPWAPTKNTIVRRVVANAHFYFVTTEDTSEIEGSDVYGNTLFIQESGTDARVNGADLALNFDFQIVGNTKMTFTSAVPADSIIEVITPSSAPELLVPNSAAKLDNISDQFDGVTRTFELTSYGEDFRASNPENLKITLENVDQEPGVDYTTVLMSKTSPSSISTNITFTVAPESGWKFWGLIGIPYGDNLGFTASDGHWSEMVTNLSVDVGLWYEVANFGPDFHCGGQVILSGVAGTDNREGHTFQGTYTFYGDGASSVSGLQQVISNRWSIDGGAYWDQGRMDYADGSYILIVRAARTQVIGTLSVDVILANKRVIPALGRLGMQRLPADDYNTLTGYDTFQSRLLT